MSVITWASPWDANFVAGGFGGGEGTVSLCGKTPPSHFAIYPF